jgi:hypothetical protein
MPFARKAKPTLAPPPNRPPDNPNPTLPQAPSWQEWTGACRVDVVKAYVNMQWNDIIGEFIKEMYPNFISRLDVAAAVRANKWQDVIGQWLKEYDPAYIARADVQAAIRAGNWQNVFWEYCKESALPTCPTGNIAPQPGQRIEDALGMFYQQYNGRFVNVSNNPYGAQCVELANAWCDFLQIERFPGNAADFQFDSHPDCEWITNSPTNYPHRGDIVVWGTSSVLPFGHVGIDSSSQLNTLTTFDQNWPIGSPAHLQSHTYVGVTGWLSPLPARMRKNL